jgi:hypothetical protein
MKSRTKLNALVLRNILKPDAPAKAVELLAGMLSQTQLEYIATVIYDDDYQFLNKDDYFKTKWNETEFGGTTNIDQLYDLGLYKDGYVYGHVINSDDWGTSIDPYYYRMQCALYLYNDDLKLSIVDVKIETANLIKIDKSEIKYFNNGSNITSTT